MRKIGVIRILCIPFILFISTGCTSVPSYHILVNGYAEVGADSTLSPGARVHVLGEENPDNPLLDQKLEKQLNRLLQEHDLRPAALDEADYCLHYRYGMGTEPVQKTRYEPGYWSPPLYHGWHDPYLGWYEGGRYVSYIDLEYGHRLVLHLFEAPPYRADRSRTMIWVGDALSVSPSPDLRTALAYLLVALFNHFGEDTGKGLEMKIGLDDPRAQLLR
jgi:hypothetical protein